MAAGALGWAHDWLPCTHIPIVMNHDSPLPASFCLVIRFFPRNLSPYRVWEVSVLNCDNEESPLLTGLSVISSNIKSGFDILGQFSLLSVCIWEGEIAGGGFFSYLLLFGLALLGSGCISEYGVIGLSNEELRLRNSVFGPLSFLLEDLLSGPSLLHWGYGLRNGPLDFSALCFVNPHRIVLRTVRWGNLSFWHQLLGVGIEANNLWVEDTSISVCEIRAYSDLSFIDRGFALKNYYNDCPYGSKHSFTDAVSSKNREVE